MKHLPLLDWTPPSRVLVFPLARRTSKVRHVAEMLSRRQGDDADLYWRQVISAARKSLERLGIHTHAIGGELMAFRNAVQRELIRLSNCGGRSGGGAA
ncbi:DUF6074 family protein [Rhodoligotrophos ferricapiens]|uniref:DUF6074 family protein n=1 Tax=Rhodoligotrophos ferricapiens TaxID=3069264 RepID=UPI00315CFBAF